MRTWIFFFAIEEDTPRCAALRVDWRQLWRHTNLIIGAIHGAKALANEEFMRKSNAFLAVFFLASLFTASAIAQTAARITGIVSDASHARIAGTAILARNLSTGQQRQGVSDSQGIYTLTELPIGAYQITVSREGFDRQVVPSVKLGVSEIVNLDFVLKVGKLEQSVTVAADSEALIESATSLGTTLDTAALAQLPINGRDYARFTLLTPGAVATTNILANISFNGQQISANRFSIDGVDASRVDYPYIANGFERGARLLTGSLETIAEFRALTSVYPAEYGRAASGFVTIVTKGGGNQFHGTAYDYIRNDLFDSRNYFNTVGQRQAEFRFNNFGASVGGPIRRNKDFFFLNYEGSRQVIGITGTGTTPSSTLRQQVLAKSPVLASLLAQFPTGTSTTSNALIDSYTTNQSDAIREDTGSARIDHSFGSNNSFFARFNVNDSYVYGPEYGVFPNSLGVSDYQSVPIRVTNIALRDQQLVGSSFVNVFLAGLQRYDSILDSLEKYPLTTITGLSITPGTRGTSNTANTSLQLNDDMSFVHGRNTLKWGVQGYRLNLNTRSLATTAITFTSIADFINNSAFSASQTGANSGSSVQTYQLGAYIQNTWRARQNLTLDYGIRWDYQTPAYDPNNKLRTFDFATNALAATGTSFYDAAPHNFSPRFGLSYSVSPKLVVRTGFGIFYQQFPLYSSNQFSSNTATGTTSLLRSQVPALSYPLDSFLGLSSAALPAVVGFNRTKPDIYGEQWNLAGEYALAKDTAVTVAYVGNRTLHLRQNQNINYVNPSTGKRPIAGYSNIIMELAGGIGNYSAFQAQLTQRFHHGLQATASYTYGHALDNVQDYGVSSGYSLQPQTNNNWTAEYGNATSDIRHSLNYSVSYDLPFGRRGLFLQRTPAVVNNLISGWQFSSVGSVRTGTPTTIFIGTNTSGNGSTTNQRPNRVTGVSQYAANRNVKQWFNPAAFTTPAAGTVGNLARNTVYGPSFQQYDASLVKRTPIADGRSLELRAEVFNVPNTPNFTTPSNTFNTSTFGQTLNTFGRTIGSGTARQMQVAAKLIF